MQDITYVFCWNFIVWLRFEMMMLLFVVYIITSYRIRIIIQLQLVDSFEHRIDVLLLHYLACTNTILYLRPLVQLGTQVDAIVRGLEKQLYDKNDKTRQSCFSLLGELVTVLPGCLTAYIDVLLPALHKSLRYVFICNFYCLSLEMIN